jgi:hypothetical protein
VRRSKLVFLRRTRVLREQVPMLNNNTPKQLVEKRTVMRQECGKELSEFKGHERKYKKRIRAAEEREYFGASKTYGYNGSSQMCGGSRNEGDSEGL